MLPAMGSSDFRTSMSHMEFSNFFLILFICGVYNLSIFRYLWSLSILVSSLKFHHSLRLRTFSAQFPAAGERAAATTGKSNTGSAKRNTQQWVVDMTFLWSVAIVDYWRSTRLDYVLLNQTPDPILPSFDWRAQTRTHVHTHTHWKQRLRYVWVLVNILEANRILFGIVACLGIPSTSQCGGFSK